MPLDTPVNPANTTADIAPVSGRSIPGTRPTKTGGLDGRTKLARRAKELLKALTERLGNPTDALIVADCRALVELKTLAERNRGLLLETENRSSTELGRIEFLIRHAEARLGLKPGATASEETNPYAFGGLFVDDVPDEAAEPTP